MNVGRSVRLLQKARERNNGGLDYSAGDLERKVGGFHTYIPQNT